jgi:hypothetical protein
MAEYLRVDESSSTAATTDFQCVAVISHGYFTM